MDWLIGPGQSTFSGDRMSWLATTPGTDSAGLWEALGLAGSFPSSLWPSGFVYRAPWPHLTCLPYTVTWCLCLVLLYSIIKGVGFTQSPSMQSSLHRKIVLKSPADSTVPGKCSPGVYYPIVLFLPEPGDHKANVASILEATQSD